MKKFLLSSISLCLGANLVVKLVILLSMQPMYWFDEIALSLISKSPAPEIFDVVLSERFHPPGFYFFLKLLPLDNMVLSKIIITVISYSIVFAALIYANKNSLIVKYKLKYGLLLFFCSFLFLTMSSDLKQDAISFPLALAIFFMLLKFSKSKKLKPKETIIYTLLAIALFFTAYVNYFFVLAGALGIFFVIRRDGLLKKSLMTQAFLLMVYFPYGISQYLTAKERSYWTFGFNNSFFENVEISLSGMSLSGFAGDLVLLTILLLVALFVTNYKKYMPFSFGARNMFTVWAAILLVSLPVLYFHRFFIVPRYSSFVFFLISIFFGWGMVELTKKLQKQAVVSMLTCLLLLLSFASYANRIKKTSSQVDFIASNVSKQSEEGIVGFLSDHHHLPLIYKLWFFKDNANLVPLNAYNPNAFVDVGQITKESQTYEKMERVSDVNYIANRLEENDLKKIMFLDIPYENESNLDRHNQILQALQNICNLEEVILPQESGIQMRYYSFANCGNKDE